LYKTLVIGTLAALASAQAGRRAVAVRRARARLDGAEDGFDGALDEAENAADEAADDFGDDAEDALADAEATASDAADEFVGDEAEAVEVPAVPKTVAEEMVEEDFWVLLIGLDSIFCTLWWLIFGWFVYIETNA